MVGMANARNQTVCYQVQILFVIIQITRYSDKYFSSLLIFLRAAHGQPFCLVALLLISGTHKVQSAGTSNMYLETLAGNRGRPPVYHHLQKRQHRSYLQAPHRPTIA